MSEPTIGLGEPIDPDIALCVEWDRSGRSPRPAGTVACDWCGFWHAPGEDECPDAPRPLAAGGIVHSPALTVELDPDEVIVPLQPSAQGAIAGISPVEYALDRLLDQVGAQPWQRAAAHSVICGRHRYVVSMMLRMAGRTATTRLIEQIIATLTGHLRPAADHHQRETPAASRMHQAYRSRQLARRRRGRRA